MFVACARCTRARASCVAYHRIAGLIGYGMLRSSARRARTLCAPTAARRARAPNVHGWNGELSVADSDI
eukprot:11198022-Lingulodinium_polyedra.AAC.1